MGLSMWQILLVAAIALLLLGPKRIPGLGKSLGEAIRGFKKGISGDDEIDVTGTSAEKDQINEAKASTVNAKQSEKEPEKV